MIRNGAVSVDVIIIIMIRDDGKGRIQHKNNNQHESYILAKNFKFYQSIKSRHCNKLTDKFASNKRCSYNSRQTSQCSTQPVKVSNDSALSRAADDVWWKGENQISENFPPKTSCMFIQHVLFFHFPVSFFSCSMPYIERSNAKWMFDTKAQRTRLFV